MSGRKTHSEQLAQLGCCATQHQQKVTWYSKAVTWGFCQYLYLRVFCTALVWALFEGSVSLCS